jgi:hypothetical protein
MASQVEQVAALVRQANRMVSAAELMKYPETQKLSWIEDGRKLSTVLSAAHAQGKICRVASKTGGRFTYGPLGMAEEQPTPPRTAVTLPFAAPALAGMDGLDGMARLIGRRIATLMIEAMRAEIEEQLASFSNGLVEKWANEVVAPSIHPAQQAKASPRKPTVLIAGLLPMQAGLISSEFSEVFDLRFFDSEGSLQKLKSMSKVDHAFTFTSKISHAVEEVIRATGTPVQRCSGGMTMLREKLTSLYVGQS